MFVSAESLCALGLIIIINGYMYRVSLKKVPLEKAASYFPNPLFNSE